MSIVLLFLIAFVIALLGMLIPGMLNITAAKISVDEGRTRALVYVAGVCVVFTTQTVIAVFFAKYINARPELNAILQKIAFVIFTFVTIYFIVLGNKKQKMKIKPPRKSKKSHFFSGMFMAVLNVLPIPFQAFMSASVAGLGWLHFNTIEISTYIIGATLGTFTMLYLYIFFFHKYSNKSKEENGKMSYIVAFVTGLIALVTLFRIFKS